LGYIGYNCSKEEIAYCHPGHKVTDRDPEWDSESDEVGNGWIIIAMTPARKVK